MNLLLRHLTGSLLLLVTILPVRLEGTRITTVIITLTRTVIEEATETPIPNTTFSSYSATNTTREFDPSVVQGETPRSTSTDCAHSMTHVIPLAPEPTMTTLPSPPMTPIQESLNGSMNIRINNLPVSGAPQEPADDTNEGDNSATAKTTATRKEDMIAWSYMDPKGGGIGDMGWVKRLLRRLGEY
jgi:hypothetical protein